MSDDRTWMLAPRGRGVENRRSMTQEPAENPPQPTLDVAATATILARIRSGDEVARDDLFRRFEAPLLRFLHGRLPPAARGVLDSHDAAQEICLKVFRSLDSFEHRGVGAFWAFLRSAALNYVRDLSRTPGKLSHASPLMDASAAPPVAATAPLDRVIRGEDFDSFERSVAVLDERTRGALLMRFELDAEYSAIAEEFGYASSDAARMAVTRAIERVAAEMARERRES